MQLYSQLGAQACLQLAHSSGRSNFRFGYTARVGSRDSNRDITAKHRLRPLWRHLSFGEPRAPLNPAISVAFPYSNGSCISPPKRIMTNYVM